MEKINLSKEFNKFLLVISAILFSLLLSVFFIKPKINQYFEAKKMVDDQEVKIDKLSRKVDDLRALSETELASSYELLFKALPETKDFYTVVSSVKKLFLDEGGIIDSYSFDPGAVSTSSDSAEAIDSGTSIDLINVKVNFLADFDKSARIIERIGNNLPILSVDSFSLSSEISGQATASSVLGIYSGKIDLIAYNSPLPAMTGSLDKELPKMTSQKMSLIEKLKQYGRVLAEEPEVSEEMVIVSKENPFP